LGTRESGRGGHPATFPEQLPDMCIRFSGIAPGSRVYDPFNGTGTTVLAAIKNGMYGIGTDVDQSYLDFSEKRIKFQTKNQSLADNDVDTESSNFSDVFDIVEN
jgi:site-specific DNA-methyltransferase (adenine-specific)